MSDFTARFISEFLAELATKILMRLLDRISPETLHALQDRAKRAGKLETFLSATNSLLHISLARVVGFRISSAFGRLSNSPIGELVVFCAMSTACWMGGFLYFRSISQSLTSFTRFDARFETVISASVAGITVFMALRVGRNLASHLETSRRRGPFVITAAAFLCVAILKYFVLACVAPIVSIIVLLTVDAFIERQENRVRRSWHSRAYKYHYRSDVTAVTLGRIISPSDSSFDYPLSKPDLRK